MNISIFHRTRYRYDHEVGFSDQVVYLRPREGQLLRVGQFNVRSEPECRQRWVRDAYNNIALVLSPGLQKSRELLIECRLSVLSEDCNPFDFVLENYATAYPFSYSATDWLPLRAAVECPVAGSDSVMEWYAAGEQSPYAHGDVVAFLSNLNRRIGQQIGYLRREEEGVQTPDHTLALRQGSCRDMAMLFIAICRRLGLAARFVSGYLYDPPLAQGGCNRALGSMHAWAEVYLPGAGWKGFDPTNGILADAAFIPTAVALEPQPITPIQGRFFCNHPVSSSIEVDLDITRLDK